MIILILIVIFIILIFYALSVKPSVKRKNEFDAYKKYYIAHRGLFNNTDIPENSMPAFQKAIECGFGIELDVQITKDGELVVFHDKTLKRMCNDKRALYTLDYCEIQKLSLVSTPHGIPLFKDVLSCVSGKVPLVIEIKPEGDFIKTSKLADQMLNEYKGKYCIESFHPLVLKWFKKYSPKTLRGQLSTVYTQKTLNKPVWLRFLLNNMMFNFITKPDFIAYNYKHRYRFTYKLCTFLYRPVTFAWTLRSQRALDSIKNRFDAIIFDSFIPKNK